MKLFDYHIHTELSHDSVTTLKEVTDAAVENNLSEVAITNHFDFGKDGGIYCNVESFKDYYKKYLDFCEENMSSVPVRFGIEAGQSYENKALFEEVLSVAEFDFILSSIHFIDGIELYHHKYEIAELDCFMDKYLENLWEIAELGDFDCLGHIDLIKRYAARDGIIVDFSKYEDKLIAILKRVIARNKGIELNTSGYRQAIGEPLPGLYILKLYKSLGGKILTIGSDAHEKENIGANITDAYALAKEAGFTEICTFKNRKPIFNPID